jgi:BlaI family penicillinase repressor
MKRLTKKENFIMQMFWENGHMTVNELLELYPEPKPHFNTVSTQVRNLEANGFFKHRREGMTYRYFPIITPQEYSNAAIGRIVSKCFKNSYIEAVSALVKDDIITIEELKGLIKEIEAERK